MNIKPQLHTSNVKVSASNSSDKMTEALTAFANDKKNDDNSELLKSNSNLTIDFSYTQPPVTYDPRMIRGIELRTIGLQHYGIHREHIGTDENGRVYKDTYGDFEGREKIDEFLSIFDRLSEERQFEFAHFKPTQALLDVANRLSDEELGQLTDFIVQSLSVNSFEQRRNDYSTELINKLNGMSDEVLQDTIQTMSKLMEQADNKVFEDPVFPPYLLDEDGRVDTDLQYTESGIFEHVNTYGDMNNQLLNDFAQFVISNKFSDGEILDLNAKFVSADFDTSRGLLDMATLVKPNDRTSFMEMLSEIDTEEPGNLFARLSKLNYENENTEYFKTNNQEYIKFEGKPADDNEKSRLYKQLIKAYENQGLGWMNDVMEESQGMPVRAELDMWLSVLEDVEENPEAFKRSDSVETWMENNLAGIVSNYYQGIKEKLFRHNDEQDLPLIMSGLERITLDSQSDEEAELGDAANTSVNE
ncbi:hypothetical protein HUZ36_01285 [Pseudoalteromonas sp. McH1-7]|uniref:Uncharacterized protein n=1 Tax=Pseudoalteromonas peptidolytica F12-50-A1 TaxID=1315280 RepID=A0A8I0T465_9GAMM|nr:MULTISPECIES: hypothetical protein [Pseudoalteromonas]MBE0346680.1 hypothetical protein [Pseudoalteromonas peptidolytica F12-50-A1]MDW7549862.1 hypothetical protein [Pseudoalteromonas peptidolytica]NLR13595.1 hypothetical protein [Pseudoalteromonas peptidolytica]NUZ09402.1 hypothetical protein [Pseudoalteromonas sp. McH1-7]USD29803.1 hypothetical protein J8Z24_06855 [Pseudoalteromonas sp. SCSIO 43201]